MTSIQDIQPLDQQQKKKFKEPARRIIEARRRISLRYHEDPLPPDLIPEYDAIQHWPYITSVYSGIEQAIKCLLQISGQTIDRSLRHHKIGALFRTLPQQDQGIIRHYYAPFQSLHNYIPHTTADEFLDAIDDGYQTWRYFLLEGTPPPRTHSGAMLETWTALCDILQAKTYTNHGNNTVKDRIYFELRQRIFRDAVVILNDLDQSVISEIATLLNRHTKTKLINYCTDLIARHAHNHSLDLSEQVMARVIRERKPPIAHPDKDYQTFLNEAERTGIFWIEAKNQFTATQEGAHT